MVGTAPGQDLQPSSTMTHLPSPKLFDNVASATYNPKPSSVLEHLREAETPARRIPESPAPEVSFPVIILQFWGPLFLSADKITSFADLLLQ